MAYINSNIVGFLNILENCRHYNVDHLVYASTSSVYGANTNLPFSSHDSANHPLTVYAASKKSNELLSHVYSHLFKIPSTGLRFFTVYGPWGRPDMALFKFTKAILKGEPIDVYNFGNHTRDFTYIDDIVNGVIKVLDCPTVSNSNWNSKQPDPATSSAPWRIFNIGNNKPIKLLDYINALEEALGKKAKKNYMPMQLGDVSNTCADIDDLFNNFNFKPSTKVNEGIVNFVNWYKSYYKLNE
jgi:UDP-glucuronate 4-epimerase